MSSTRSLLACPPCETGPFTRNHFFTGKLLVERDFTDEQRYFIDKLRHHHQRLHGWGVVCGLKVKPHPSPACRDRFVCIEPGTAVDCCGREVVVREEECVDLSSFAELRELFERAGDEDARAHALRLSICYRECPTEDIPVLYDECGCDDTHCAPNRILESFRFTVEVDPPEEPAADAPGAGLEHVHTLAVAQARRVAVDAENGRIYVLSGAAPATLTAFSAANHSLVGSVGFAATEKVMDLAVSADGQLVFVSLLSTGETHPLKVRVLGSDLSAQNDLTIPHSAGGNQVFVAAASGGRLYALNGNDRKLYTWDNPDTDAAGARQELPTIGNGPSALRVAPDGARAFAAAADGASVTVFEAADGSNETLSLHAGARPVSLAAVGAAGAERLLVGDEDRHLHLFGVHPGKATPFPDLGTATLPGTPVALAATRGGRWVFALLEAADGTASVQVVDAHAVETGSGDPLGASVEVEARPRSLALSRDGKRLYAASEGPVPAGGAAPGGGVAVIDVTQTDCAEIFLRSLKGCPECAEECLTLATLRDWLPGTAIKEGDIDNLDGRHLLPSTTDIVDVVRCLLERECDCEGGGAGEPGHPGPSGPAGPAGLQGPQGERGETGARGPSGPQGLRGETGAAGPAGPQGLRGETGAAGPAGSQGPAGPGLEPGLTRIRALSWKHRSNTAQFIPIMEPDRVTPILDPGTRQLLAGVVIGFTRDVVVNAAPTARPWLPLPAPPPPPLVDDHVFQVLGLLREENQQLAGLRCRCALGGFVLPVEFETDGSGERIVNAWLRVEGAAGNMLARTAPGVAWVGNSRLNYTGLATTPIDLWVQLRGDFVVDTGGRAVDAEFTRADLPTGDRPAELGVGVQGGLFESWFTVNPLQPVRVSTGVRAVVVNRVVEAGMDREAAERLADAMLERPLDPPERAAERAGFFGEALERFREMITDRDEEG